MTIPHGAMSSPYGQMTPNEFEEIPSKYCGLPIWDARERMKQDKLNEETSRINLGIQAGIAKALDDQSVELTAIEFATLNQKLTTAGFEIDPSSTMKRIVYKFGGTVYHMTKPKA